MATYGISGVWKDNSGTITHYAVHTKDEQTGIYSFLEKKTKAQAVALVEIRGNTANTWVWNYVNGSWNIGEQVHVVTNGNTKYLRSDADKRVTDNLGHLINYASIAF